MSIKYAGFIAEWLIAHKAIRREEYDLYVYAVHSLIMTLAPLGLALVLGVLMGCAVTAVTIIFPFMVIRKFSGGYHAKQAWICLIGSPLILGGCIWLSDYITYDRRLIGVMLIAAVLLMINSPVESENRRLDGQERLAYKKVTIGLVLVSVLISFICYKCNLEKIAANLALGIILTGWLQVPCIQTNLSKRTCSVLKSQNDNKM